MAAAGIVYRSVSAELRQLNANPESSGLAALALALAQQIDTARGAVAAAAAAGQLRLVLAELKAANVKPQQDGISDLEARRERRRRGTG